MWCNHQKENNRLKYQNSKKIKVIISKNDISIRQKIKLQEAFDFNVTMLEKMMEK